MDSNHGKRSCGPSPNPSATGPEFERVKKQSRFWLVFLLRSQADSNRCKRSCRPLPSHSAMGPFKERRKAKNRSPAFLQKAAKIYNLSIFSQSLSKYFRLFRLFGSRTIHQFAINNLCRPGIGMLLGLFG